MSKLTSQSQPGPQDPSNGDELLFDRLDELLAADLAGMLDDAERAELEAMLASREDSSAAERSFAETAARFTVGSVHPAAALEHSLRERLLASANAHLPQAGSVRQMPQQSLMPHRDSLGLPLGRTPTRQTNSSSPFRMLLAFGGYALAACLLVVVLVQNRGGSSDPDLVSARVELLNRDGVSPLPWKATAEGDPASGDVVWSPARQTGYMRFANFRANDPSKSQYQLWIFDRDRPEATPVDGGVFDIPAGKEAIVPIKPTLPVSKATLFAITEEPPGGVVVSDRKRLHLVAPVP